MPVSVVNVWVGEKALGWELGALGSSHYWVAGQEPQANSPQIEGSRNFKGECHGGGHDPSWIRIRKWEQEINFALLHFTKEK